MFAYFAYCDYCKVSLETPTETDCIVGVQNCPRCREDCEICQFRRREAIEALLKTVDDLNRKLKNSHFVRTPEEAEG